MDSERTTLEEGDDIEEDTDQAFFEAASFLRPICYMLQLLNNVPNTPVTVTNPVKERIDVRTAQYDDLAPYLHSHT